MRRGHPPGAKMTVIDARLHQLQTTAAAFLKRGPRLTRDELVAFEFLQSAKYDWGWSDAADATGLTSSGATKHVWGVFSLWLNWWQTRGGR